MDSLIPINDETPTILPTTKLSLMKITSEQYQEEEQQTKHDAPIVSSYNDRIQPLLDTVDRLPHLNRNMDSKGYPAWEDLPFELIATIAKFLTSIHDYVSFRGVCNSWRSAATFGNFDHAYPRVPWLMYVTKEERERMTLGPDSPKVANFRDLSNKKTNKIINFPQTDRSVHLSCGGWILDVSEACVSLTNPIWRTKIELPGTDTFPVPSTYKIGNLDCFIRKVAMSNSPAIKSDLVIAVIWGRDSKLALARPGDSSWTQITSWDDYFVDITYHNGKLYALDFSQRVVECEIHGTDLSQMRQVFALQNFNQDIASANTQRRYLVESCGKLLIVIQILRVDRTCGFKVFEFDLKIGSPVEISDLGNKALFLSFNSSYCLDLSGLRNVKVVKRNCIYFTDHTQFEIGSKEGKVRVYSLSQRRFSILIDRLCDSIYTPPTWVMPSF